MSQQQKNNHGQEEEEQQQEQYKIEYQKISKLLELISDSEEEDTNNSSFSNHNHNQITCLNDVALKNEIITEHFGFLPISFVDDIINSVNELIYMAIAGIDNFVNSELTNKEEVEQDRKSVV